MKLLLILLPPLLLVSCGQPDPCKGRLDREMSQELLNQSQEASTLATTCIDNYEQAMADYSRLLREYEREIIIRDAIIDSLSNAVSRN